MKTECIENCHELDRFRGKWSLLDSERKALKDLAYEAERFRCSGPVAPMHDSEVGQECLATGSGGELCSDRVVPFRYWSIGCEQEIEGSLA